MLDPQPRLHVRGWGQPSRLQIGLERGAKDQSGSTRERDLQLSQDRQGKGQSQTSGVRAFSQSGQTLPQNWVTSKGN